MNQPYVSVSVTSYTATRYAEYPDALRGFPPSVHPNVCIVSWKGLLLFLSCTFMHSSFMRSLSSRMLTQPTQLKRRRGTNKNQSTKPITVPYKWGTVESQSTWRQARLPHCQKSHGKDSTRWTIQGSNHSSDWHQRSLGWRSGRGAGLTWPIELQEIKIQP
jgi:hypothetical protein